MIADLLCILDPPGQRTILLVLLDHLRCRLLQGISRKWHSEDQYCNDQDYHPNAALQVLHPHYILLRDV